MYLLASGKSVPASQFPLESWLGCMVKLISD